MKANELMIGDWVLANGEPHRVSILARYCDDNHEVTDTIGCQGIGKSGEVTEVELESIPLTEEILKTNGWEEYKERYDIVCYRVLTEKDSAFIEPMKIKSRLGDKWFWFTNGNRETEVVKPHLQYPLVYVHELQHALRLCGLGEIADDFKI